METEFFINFLSQVISANKFSQYEVSKKISNKQKKKSKLRKNGVQIPLQHLLICSFTVFTYNCFQ